MEFALLLLPSSSWLLPASLNIFLWTSGGDCGIVDRSFDDDDDDGVLGTESDDDIVLMDDSGDFVIDVVVVETALAAVALAAAAAASNKSCFFPRLFFRFSRVPGDIVNDDVEYG